VPRLFTNLDSSPTSVVEMNNVMSEFQRAHSLSISSDRFVFSLSLWVDYQYKSGILIESIKH
jgi:hypothetical protein